MHIELPYSSSQSGSSEAFTDILSAYLRSSNQTMPKLDQLLAEDPEFTMGHVLRGYLLKLASDSRLIPPAKACLKKAQSLAANPREALHIKALASWLDGDADKTLAGLEQLLDEFPTDVLAARITHHLHFYSGDANAMQASITRVAKQIPEAHPLYGFVQGMHSFGCEEAGDYAAAETLGRRAVALDPRDQWATHAVAHVMQMQNRFDEGVAWLQAQVPNFTDSNNFVYHIHWHEALFELGRNQPERAIEIYDQHLIAPLKDDFYLDVCNAASLLYRLDMIGFDVGDRWQALADFNHRTADAELIFCTLHYLLAPLRLGNQEAVSVALEQLSDWQSQTDSQAKIVTEVGRPLASALCLLEDQQFSSAAEQIEEILPKLHLIGGSHAQRELFHDMLAFAKQQAA